MAKRKGPKPPKQNSPSRIQLPRNALGRIQLGNSFAEYDPLLHRPGVFVTTPQVILASKEGGGCFFVGRRGTGKTATTLYLKEQFPLSITIHPRTFEFENLKINTSECRDTRQRPFKSLMLSFQRAIICEVLQHWSNANTIRLDRLPPPLQRERNFMEDFDFDARTLHFLDEFQQAETNDKEWLRLTRRSSKELPESLNRLEADQCTMLLLDRIDEAWDGSDQAVILLMALMHACVELQAKCRSIKPKLFLRENIFERVREIDNEFARLETFVVSMDWTEELLLELVERRLNEPFNTKLPLRGPTWDYFFESTGENSARRMVFTYCQERPRDILTYCKLAIDAAQSRQHEKVQIEDLLDARKRFSDSRLKDLGDEYAENYPQIQLILSRFFGLGTEFSLPGIDAFIQKLLVDDQIKERCASWIYEHTTTDRFVHLLYNIGFFGIKNGAEAQYRSVGAKSSTPPALSPSTHVTIHPSYQAALSLRGVIITQLSDAAQLQPSGLLQDLPDSLKLDEYTARLDELLQDLKTLPCGDAHATQFEDIVGEVIRLCFHRSLANVQPQQRDYEGRTRRDWVAANRALFGFWQVIREKYGAIQVSWECKNYEDLEAGDFHQLAYYCNQTSGSFIVCVFRGEIKKHYYGHIKRVAQEQRGMVLLLTDRDLATFMRQARVGKAKEDHIQEIYDRIVRSIS